MALTLVQNLPQDEPENDFQEPDEDPSEVRSFFDIPEDDEGASGYLRRFFALYLRDSADRGFARGGVRIAGADELLAGIESRIIPRNETDLPMTERHTKNKDRIRDALTERPGMTGAEIVIRTGLPKIGLEVLLCQLVRQKFLWADGTSQPQRYFRVGSTGLPITTGTTKPSTAPAPAPKSSSEPPAPSAAPSMKVRVSKQASMSRADAIRSPEGQKLVEEYRDEVPRLPARVPPNPAPILPPETDVETMLENKLQDVQRRREAVQQTMSCLDREAQRLTAALAALRSE